MVKWRAVAFGLAVQVTLVFASVLVPLVGHAAAGLAGGFVAGFLAGGGPNAGWQHGVVTGVIGGVATFLFGGAVALFVGLDAVVVPGIADALGPLLSVGAGLPLLLVGALLVVVCADSAGALGGWLRGERRFPGRIENERP